MRKIKHRRIPDILNKVERLNFVVFKSGKNYDLNIIGVRNPENTPNSFDDHIHVCYQLNGVWYEEIFTCTTDPGQYWLNNPMKVSGTAILVSPQQCRSAYTIGYHRGQYEALVQSGAKVKLWRDNNHDSIVDYGEPGQEESSFSGINIHRSSSTNDSAAFGINKWSAGCQVMNNPTDFRRFMELCKLQISHTGYKTFTYTLIDGDEP